MTVPTELTVVESAAIDRPASAAEIRAQVNLIFFAVDKRSWVAACDLGMQAAVAYLVLATGTGRDNRTSWSTNAIERCTGIGRKRAKAAIGKLTEAAMERSRSSKHHRGW